MHQCNSACNTSVPSNSVSVSSSSKLFSVLQLRQFGNARAIDQHFTYDELYDVVNALNNILQNLCNEFASSGDRGLVVPVLCSKIDTICANLAVMQLNCAAFMNLDVSLQHRRSILEASLNSLHSPIVIVSQSLFATSRLDKCEDTRELLQSKQYRWIFMQRDSPNLAYRTVVVLNDNGACHSVIRGSLPFSSPENTLSAQRNTAFVVQTSGTTTTGLSKRPFILVPHSSPLFNVLSFRDRFQLRSEHDKVFLTAPVTFDAFVVELLVALYCGATVVVSDLSSLGDMASVARFIESRKCTAFLHCTPTFFEMLHRNSFDYSSLRMICFGGEPLFSTAIVKWFGYHPPLRVFNAYGISEVSAWATLALICEANGSVPPTITVDSRTLSLPLVCCIEDVLPGTHIEIHSDAQPDIDLLQTSQNEGLGTLSIAATSRRAGGTTSTFFPTGDLVHFSWSRAQSQLELRFYARTGDLCKVVGKRFSLHDVRALIANLFPRAILVAIQDWQSEQFPVAVGDTLTILFVPAEKSAESLVFYDLSVELEVVSTLKTVLRDYQLPAVVFCLSKEYNELGNNGKLNVNPLMAFVANGIENEVLAPETYQADDFENIVNSIVHICGAVLCIEWRSELDPLCFSLSALGSSSLETLRIAFYLCQFFKIQGHENDLSSLLARNSLSTVAYEILRLAELSKTKRLCRSVSSHKTNREELWKVEFKECVDASPVITSDGSTVFVASHSGELRAVHCDTGRVLWSTDLNGRVDTSVCLIANDSFGVVNTNEGECIMFDCGTGSIRVRLQIHVRGAPVCGHEKFYLCARTPSLLAYSFSGNLAWKTPLDSMANIAAIYDRGNEKLFLTTFDGKLLCCSALDGSVLWTVTLSVNSAAFMAPPTLLTAGLCFCANIHGTIFCIDTDGDCGTILWQRTCGAAIHYRLCVLETSCVAVCGKELFALSKHDGSVLWHLTAPALITCAPVRVSASRVVLVASDRIVFFNRNGELESEREIALPACSFSEPVVLRNGALVLGARDNVLRSVAQGSLQAKKGSHPIAGSK